MDMSTHPTTDKTKTSLPGEPHNRDMSNPGELWAFLLAAALLGGLGVDVVVAGAGAHHELQRLRGVD